MALYYLGPIGGIILSVRLYVGNFRKVGYIVQGYIGSLDYVGHLYMYIYKEVITVWIILYYNSIKVGDYFVGFETYRIRFRLLVASLVNGKLWRSGRYRYIYINSINKEFHHTWK